MVAVRSRIGSMARKKPSERTTEGADDRHKPNFTVRIPMAYAPAVDSLVDATPGSDRSEVVRNALKEYLSRLGLWPPTRE